MKLNFSNSIERPLRATDHTEKQLKRAFDAKYAVYIDEMALYESLGKEE